MHIVVINNTPRDCLFGVVCGSESLAKEKLAAAIEATGDTSMYLHLETETEYKEAWY
jgi:hypothetical protein